MNALRACLIGLLLWGIPSLGDLHGGGYGFAAETLWFWLLAAPIGCHLLYRECRRTGHYLVQSAGAGLGTTLAVIGMSVLHASTTDNWAELGGGIQNFSTASSVLFGFVMLGFCFVAYLLPTGLGAAAYPKAESEQQRII